MDRSEWALVPRHYAENIAAAATLLEATHSVFDRREADVLRKIVALIQAPPSPAEQASGGMAGKINDMIDAYWELAYAEGKEGREHDTEQGDAQRIRSELSSAIAALSQRPVVEEATRGLADEYRRWIDFYHGGNGDYDSFLQLELAPQHSEKGEG